MDKNGWRHEPDTKGRLPQYPVENYKTVTTKHTEVTVRFSGDVAANMRTVIKLAHLHPNLVIERMNRLTKTVTFSGLKED